MGSSPHLPGVTLTGSAPRCVARARAWNVSPVKVGPMKLSIFLPRAASVLPHFRCSRHLASAASPVLSSRPSPPW